ncbi:glycerol-3-phosphate 1-O-acyltransferase PlsY [Lacihabitans soyangensis]|jgi:acyl phosphate:glycerol-3-phosphate acyltransferase|uniref:Glycerol-3-phosphate acyltransferase n=1 Tax=Lacihabitans soyangensis TaxID=869394 RepID=A0AAE3H0V2_9BACT|nr:glycerol-3-phosphate 1-O-acyltransferase PlsY [Lacihabitans soyangensis]MCP9761924.1 glycerol-3-phosphate 1-O-acyltransferase [Lacihabitans soyangensis]
MLLKVVVYAFAYLVGSIPTAYWYAKYFHGIDIRQHGSGNVGATNSLRVLGKKAGIIVLIFDLLKGLLPVLLARYLDFSEEQTFTVGIVAILGHIWSVFANFKGGKGIATSLGVILAVSPAGAGLSVAVFVAVVYFTRYVSLASMLAGLTFVFYYLFFNFDQTYMSLIAFGLFLLLVFTHRENIKRLAKGTESKISSKK